MGADTSELGWVSFDPASAGAGASSPELSALLARAVRHGLERAAHLLPDQGPLHAFVHHNTLHAFQHLPFHEALQQAYELYGAEPYLTEEKYRAFLREGRITEDDLRECLRAHVPASGRSFGGLFTEEHVRFTMLRFSVQSAGTRALAWLIEEREVTRRLRSDVAEWEREVFFVCSQDWLRRLLSGGDSRAALRFGRAVTGKELALEVERELRQSFGLPLDCARLRTGLSREPEQLVVSALWQLCRKLTRSYVAYARSWQHRPAHPELEVPPGLRRADVHERLFPILIRLTAAYLDQGLASRSMPGRDQGFYAAVRELIAQATTLPVRWERELKQTFVDQLARNTSPMDAVIEALSELGVDADQAPGCVQALLLSLPGWAGLMSRLERHPEDRPQHAPPASLLDFLSVRLTYERALLRDLARSAGVSLRQLLLAAPSITPASVDGARDDAAYRLFQLVQLMGLPVPTVSRLQEEEALDILAVMDGFDELARRRLFQEAFERNHRVQLLDALALQRASIEPSAPVERASVQFVCCFDDREEGFRRHLEEIDPGCQTFGAPGFFGAAIRYRGFDQTEPQSLAPAGTKPAHEIEETPCKGHEDGASARRFRRKLWARLHWQAHSGSRSLARGAVLSLGAGLLSVAPLLMRVTAPRLTGKLRRWSSRAALPGPALDLTVHRAEQDTRASALGFTYNESAARVAAMLENIGLTGKHARLIILLGHGATTLNNPHKAAYDCGACGGRQGGPNARVFARMANDPLVREALAIRGIYLPPDTVFVGGQHDTCSERVVLFDLDRVPHSHSADLRAARASLDEARARSAHERCRKLLSAPRRTTPTQALAHVEARSEHLAEPRPELGHASNASAIIGRRALTRGLFLDRRAFVLSYDPSADPEGQILQRVLPAAAAVGAGINLEYYFSHVDNERYGAGSKLAHNVTGLLGVMSGHASDLRTGLPRQMVEIHEPMRLLVVVEAMPARLLQVAERDAELWQWVVNQWLQLVSIDPEGGAMQIFNGRGFEPYTPTTTSLPEAASSRDFYVGRSHLLPPARIRRFRGGTH